jgi:hypothetical protein
MDGFQEIEFGAFLSIAAFPAAGDLFFLAAFPDLAERRTTPVPASLFAPELHHGPEELVTLPVMRKGFAERCVRYCSSDFFVLCTPQFFPEIAGKTGDLPGIPVAVEAAESAIRNHLKVLLHHTKGVGLWRHILSQGKWKNPPGVAEGMFHRNRCIWDAT